MKLRDQGFDWFGFIDKTANWLRLALKRVMTMAAEGGYDRVAFVTGDGESSDLNVRITSEGAVLDVVSQISVEVSATTLVLVEDLVGMTTPIPDDQEQNSGPAAR